MPSRAKQFETLGRLSHQVSMGGDDVHGTAALALRKMLVEAVKAMPNWMLAALGETLAQTARKARTGKK